MGENGENGGKDVKEYGGGIKVYRLYGGDLYNIDLEDKTKYEEQFDGIEVTNMEKGNSLEISMNCLNVLFFLSAALVLGASIYLFISISSAFSIVK